MAKRKQQPKQRGNLQGSVFRRGGRGGYYVSWFDASGKRQTKPTNTTDKATATRILTKYVADAALRREGVVDIQLDRLSTEARKPIDEHLGDYIAHCKHVRQAPRHITQKERHLKAFIKLVKADRLQDLTADRLERYTRSLLDDGLSARTANWARQIAVAFVSWCVRTGRANANPLTVAPRLDEQRDRRRVRRPLTDDELARLMKVAEPRGRRAWYLTAALAGLRKGDLQRLRWCDLDFRAGSIIITHGKAKRTDTIPMHPQLADELKSRRDDMAPSPTDRVFPQTVTDRTRLKDFLRAGVAREVVETDENGQPVMIGKGKRQRPKKRIVVEDDEGRVIDLQAMRTTLGTTLARTGVAPQLAQRIMRHSDYRTTLKHYTVLGLTDTSKVMNAIPSVGAYKQNAKAAGD